MSAAADHISRPRKLSWKIPIPQPLHRRLPEKGNPREHKMSINVTSVDLQIHRRRAQGSGSCEERPVCEPAQSGGH